MLFDLMTFNIKLCEVHFENWDWKPRNSLLFPCFFFLQKLLKHIQMQFTISIWMEVKTSPWNTGAILALAGIKLQKSQLLHLANLNTYNNITGECSFSHPRCHGSWHICEVNFVISTSIHYNVQYVVFTVGYILHLNDNLALCNDTYCHETQFFVWEKSHSLLLCINFFLLTWYLIWNFLDIWGPSW